MSVCDAQSAAQNGLMGALERPKHEMRAHIPGKCMAAVAQDASLLIGVPCKLESQAVRIDGIFNLRRHTSNRP